ncbi:MAG: membrane protein insertion efficiency factor YidD [Gemmatimonadaceae bacterium]|nr:membrane protein insertion efficiency factor YidD [Gemmatimonadaceae bacterium]
MTTHQRRSLAAEIVLLPVRFYRRVLSPMKRTPSCRYLPTCSEYAIDAVQMRGVIVGTVLAVWRVLRCNPLFHAGHDPVPAKPGAQRQLMCSHGEPH